MLDSRIQYPVLLTVMSIFVLTSPGFAQEKIDKKTAFPSLTQRPWVGVVADPDGKNKGLRVSRILKTSPSAKAGIKVGDLIVSAQGRKTTTIAHFRSVLIPMSAGDTLNLKFIPKGQTKVKTVKMQLSGLPNQTQLIKSQWMAQVIPDMPFTIQSTGKQDSLKKYRGKVTVVEFWATWCAPCRQVTSYLTKYQTKHPNSVNIVAITSESQKTVNAYLKKQASLPPYVIARDTNSLIHKQLMVRSYPTVLILDEKHQLRKVLTGYNHPKDIGLAIDSVKKMQTNTKN